MLKIGDKEYRNLEEQVLKNKSDIEFIANEQGVLNQFGIKVVGEVADSSSLPEEGDAYGDAYAVGTESPYELYVWTRANTNHPNDYWFNIGEFPLAGPQGPQGVQGEAGPTGPTGPQGVQGPQGIQGIAGPQGPQGVQGETGPQGPQGPKGDAGNGFKIVDTLSSVNQLPTPTEAIRNEAYLVEISDITHLYVITGTDPDLLWTDCGQLEGVQGPQGETGPQGPQGVQGETGPQGPQGQQGIQGEQGIQGPKGDTGDTGPQGPKGDTGPTGVYVNSTLVSQLNFTSDPQTQINALASASGGTSENKDISAYTSIKPSTFFTKTWIGLTDFNGSNIWTDGENIYYSASTNHYVLDKATSTWSAKTWSGLTSFNGYRVWTDGINIYYSSGADQYVLDKATSTWSAKTWTGFTAIEGNSIWSDGKFIYYSNGSTQQYVLDSTRTTWMYKSWSGYYPYGYRIWTDGKRIYSSDGNYQYFLSGSIWYAKTWTGLTNFNPNYLWTKDGVVYYSNGSSQKKLDKATNTWSNTNWDGLSSFSGNSIWTDGTHIYQSDGTSHHVLNLGANVRAKPKLK